MDASKTPESPQKPMEKTISISGTITPDVWNRLGTKIIPKLRTGKDLEIKVALSVQVDSLLADSFQSEIQQILDDIGVAGNLVFISFCNRPVNGYNA